MNLNWAVFVATVLQTTLLFSDGYKIAITTPQIGSHLMGKLHIGKALVDRGHDVHLVVTDKFVKMDSIVKAGIKPLQFRTPDDAFLMDSEEAAKTLADLVFQGADVRKFDAIVSGVMLKDCEYLLNDTEAIERIKKHNFDIFIVEPFVVSPCNSILPVYLGKPYISLTLFYSHLDLRHPALPSFYSLVQAPVIPDNIARYGLREKFITIFFNILLINPVILMPGHKTDLLKKYTPQYQSWDQILRGSELFLCEGSHHLDGFPPVAPNFIQIAGMSASPPKPLPADLAKILADSGADGTILLTFGATAYYMPEKTTRKFLEAFAMINQTVLARFNVPKGLEVPKNVKTLEWMPQNDILGHPRTKLFITHCGNGGQYEALYHAVPMLGFPMFAEQYENCLRIKDRGFGLCMKVIDFTAEDLANNIRELIYNKKYAQAIGSHSEKFRDEWTVQTPQDKAMFWIEHVIKYGGRHLRSPAMELSLFEFFMLDVIFIVLLVILVLIVCVYFIIRKIYKKCFHTRPTSAGQNNKNKTKTN